MFRQKPSLTFQTTTKYCVLRLLGVYHHTLYLTVTLFLYFNITFRQKIYLTHNWKTEFMSFKGKVRLIVIVTFHLKLCLVFQVSSCSRGKTLVSYSAALFPVFSCATSSNIKERRQFSIFATSWPLLAVLIFPAGAFAYNAVLWPGSVYLRSGDASVLHFVAMLFPKNYFFNLPKRNNNA